LKQYRGTLKRKREPVSHTISVRFREAEAEVVERFALEDDMSVGAWIRKNVLRVLSIRGVTFDTMNGAQAAHDK
jgi:hypothetical protein